MLRCIYYNAGRSKVQSMNIFCPIHSTHLASRMQSCENLAVFGSVIGWLQREPGENNVDIKAGIVMPWFSSWLVDIICRFYGIDN